MATTEVWQAADPLGALTAVDPYFDPDHFLEFAEMAFFLVKKAIQLRDPNGARAFVSDPVYQQLQAEAAEMKAARRQLVLDGLWVKGLRLEGFSTEPGWDFITVSYAAAATVYTADEQGNPIQPMTGGEIDLPEKWVFVRASGVKSRIGGGVMEYKCPNCGAPFTLDDLGVCQHCRAPVASGQFDWVAREIYG